MRWGRPNTPDLVGIAGCSVIRAEGKADHATGEAMQAAKRATEKVEDVVKKAHE
jgi:uncharacterized protein YjbJ (UPF0337 family)